MKGSSRNCKKQHSVTSIWLSKCQHDVRKRDFSNVSKATLSEKSTKNVTGAVPFVPYSSLKSAYYYLKSSTFWKGITPVTAFMSLFLRLQSCKSVRSEMRLFSAQGLLIFSRCCLQNTLVWLRGDDRTHNKYSSTQLMKRIIVVSCSDDSLMRLIHSAELHSLFLCL